MDQSKFLIVTHGNNLEYLNIMLNILENSLSNFTSIEILDLSRILDDQDTFDRKILKLADIASPEEVVFRNLAQSGIRIHDASELAFFSLETKAIPIEVESALQESIRSAMVSLTGSESPKNSRWEIKRRRQYYREALTTYLVVLDFLNINDDVSQLAIINGRFPCQRAVKEAAKQRDLDCFTYERGIYESEVSQFDSAYSRYRQAHNYWFAPYTTYDRVNKQSAILDMDFSVEHLNSERISNWFTQRQAPGKFNTFANDWTDESLILRDEKYATIFTSSVDEFSELGPTWREDTWASEWEAFDAVITELLKHQYSVILRVHPNLLNKQKNSRIPTLLEIDKLKSKFPNIIVIYPNSKVSSYQILRKSELVVVWISTIGLEASAMGIKTVVLAATEYDLVADVRRWLDPSDVQVGSLSEWEVETAGARRFIAGVFAHNHAAKPLLGKYGVQVENFEKGLGLFSNKWAMRNNNNLVNLVSIFLPKKIFLILRPQFRKLKFLIIYRK